MDKKVVQAINELFQQHDQCELHCSLDAGWKATTGNLISEYTGQDSEFYQEYLKWTNTHARWGYDNDFAAQQQLKIQLLLKHTIQHVQRRGLYKTPKRRIINVLPDWATFCSAILALFAGGYQTGVSFTKRDITKDQVRIESELDSFRLGLKLGIQKFNHTSNKFNRVNQRQNENKINQDTIQKPVR